MKTRTAWIRSARTIVALLASGCAWTHAPDGFWTRPTFAEVVAGDSGPDDETALCDPKCGGHHRWPEGRARVIHEALVTAYRDSMWATLDGAKFALDTDPRILSIPPLCPKRLRDDRILEVPCQLPTTWERREPTLEPELALTRPHSAFFVMGRNPTEAWQDPILFVHELGDFGDYQTGRATGEPIAERDSGARLYASGSHDDIEVLGGTILVTTHWEQDPWSIVSASVVVVRPDGREFSISAEGPASRMIEELPGLRAFIDSLLDAP